MRPRPQGAAVWRIPQIRFHSTRAAQIRHQSARDTSKIKSKASARLGGRRGGRADGRVCGASQDAAEQTRSTLCPFPSAPPTRARLALTPTSATCWSLSYGFLTGVERGRLRKGLVGTARVQLINGPKASTIASVVDVGCGDLELTRHLPFTNYLGIANLLILRPVITH